MYTSITPGSVSLVLTPISASALASPLYAPKMPQTQHKKKNQKTSPELPSLNETTATATWPSCGVLREVSGTAIHLPAAGATPQRTESCYFDLKSLSPSTLLPLTTIYLSFIPTTDFCLKSPIHLTFLSILQIFYKHTPEMKIFHCLQWCPSAFRTKTQILPWPTRPHSG